MAFPIIPNTVTLTIASTFSPPTTCFPSTVAATYTLPPDSLVDGRLIIRGFQTQCYPTSINALGSIGSLTSTFDLSSTTTVAQATAPFFSAETCPPGFVSASGQSQASISLITCCPGTEFHLAPVDVGDYTGCVQSPGTAPITVVGASLTTTLDTPTTAPAGIAYRPLLIGFSLDHAATSSPADSGLSSGAKAGIGVGVALGVLALVSLGGLMFWWKRRKRARVETGANGAEADAGRAVHELGHNEVVEAPGTSRYAEKGVDNPNDKPLPQEPTDPVELEGDWHPVQMAADERAVEKE